MPHIAKRSYFVYQTHTVAHVPQGIQASTAQRVRLQILKYFNTRNPEQFFLTRPPRGELLQSSYGFSIIKSYMYHPSAYDVTMAS